MKFRLFVICAALLALQLSGCASRFKEMPLTRDGEVIRPDSPAILLMAVNFKNSHDPSFPLMANTFGVNKSGGANKDDYIYFLMDEKGTLETQSVEEGNTYFIRMALPKGSYELPGLYGYSGFIPLRAIFLAPVCAHFDSPGVGVHYLGRITATLRERKDGEFRAGSLIPLNSPLTPVIFASTVDVEVADRLQEDLPEFLTRFPALKSAKIEKMILPPWNRAEAQNCPHY